MKQLELLLPFSIPPAALAVDLIKQMHTPAFSTLLARSSARKVLGFEEFSRSLPHETLLAGAKYDNTDVLPAAPSSPADTYNKMQALGLAPTAGHWFTLSPVHIHIARDHLVLTDWRRLPLAEQEARALFDAAQGMCEEVGKTLFYGDAGTWFLRADDWSDMQTATPDAACGHNIDIWMAKGTQELAWRKLQNEIQMLWFAHPVNAERETRGDLPVNSVWLWGGSDEPAEAPNYARGRQALDQILAAKSENHLLVLDELLEASLNSDWGSWLQQMHHLETACMAPLLQALRDGRLQQLRLILSDGATLAYHTVSPWSLRRFWIRPNLNPLLTLAAP